MMYSGNIDNYTRLKYLICITNLGNLLSHLLNVLLSWFNLLLQLLDLVVEYELELFQLLVLLLQVVDPFLLHNDVQRSNEQRVLEHMLTSGYHNNLINS